ncbi:MULTISPECIES: VWA domain-containing protein [Gammaproteobacteria]|uniref:VWFA domain-containing protein n=5 Tax=Gammaproteobacteria TaxID=1236 RepID=A0A0U2SQN7_PROMI|nr:MULTISPECIES: VWA domain-containing protein [Gammaproteobacteria]ACV96491.1 von Willebrand factor, type A [Vibrio fluvialis Ind1]AIP92437.1 plasmid associated protein APECO1_O1R37 [Vibrio fluvialis]ECW3337685.1 VWA domain-containing protein [Salmonella enterica subsp. enterica serovar Eastbourne]EKN5236915.1 VWA domain-containing protein [Salmonella enterica]ELA7729039.1 VWA domain-containing protein [Morganella morganii]MCC1639933.1 VWA domain-containing protein [Salmonella enterica subsp
MNHPLKNALPIVAAAYGEKFGVKVLIQGQDAFTDGERIVIPTANPDDPHYQQIAWGYLAHEAAHIRHTNFDMVKKASSKPIRKALLNIIEDVRIENELAKDYPGTRRSISQVIEYMVDTQQMCVPEQPEPASNLQAWLLFRLRCHFLGQKALTPLYQAVDERVRQLFPAAAMSRLSAMLTAVPSLASTGEVLKLVDAIVAMLEEESRPPQDESDADGGDDIGQDASNDSNSSSDSQTPETSSSATGDAAETSDSDNSDQADNLRQALEASAAHFEPDTFAQVAEVLSEQAEGHQGVTPLSLPQAEQAMLGDEAILTLSASESAQIRARLRGMVQSSQDNRNHAKRYGLRVATHRLAASQAGESRLFIQRQPRIAPNAAVHLLVDISGSMGKPIGEGNRKYFHVANEAALALAMALEGIPGVVPAVSYFPGIHQEVSIALLPKQSVRHRAACFDQKPRGCTPMAQAMWFAANSLLAQKQKRKLMIVLTDGDPDDWAATHDIVDRCRRSGFELLGIGIQTRSVEKFFPRSIVINDVKDLKRELFEVTQQLIIQ